MASIHTSTQSFQQRLQYISRVYAFVGPVGVLVLCAIAQYYFGDYYSLRAERLIAPFLAFMVLLLIARIIRPRAGRARLAFEYLAITTLSTIAIISLFHFPSPYLMAGAVFAVLIYFDFGAFWAFASLCYQYGAVIVYALLYRPVSPSSLTDLLAYILPPVAFGFMVVGLQSLTRQEINSIENTTEDAVANEQQVQSLINNITDGVIAIDSDYKIAIYNAAALDVIDSNTAITGKNISSVFKPLNAEMQPVEIGSLLHGVTTPVINRNLRLKYSDGSVANIFLGMAPIYLGYGRSKNNGYTLILRDITREKSLEEERDEFISVVSHELRTPIAITEGSISNAQFIAEKSGASSAIIKLLNESHTQVMFLADMINDLSTLSRAERGKLEVDIEPISIKALVQQLVTNYKPQAKAKNLELITTADNKSLTLNSSKLYVTEILQNFITNAIKYTDDGSVTIKVTGNAKGITFAVIDTGIGISKNDQKKVFDKFFRSEDYRTRANNGTGLGLYVALKLVRLIHAEINIQSQLNEGSTFSVFIPNLK